MKRKYAFYGFRDMDHKAAEDWLMAWKARGWELERIRAGSVAVFRPLERSGGALYGGPGGAPASHRVPSSLRRCGLGGDRGCGSPADLPVGPGPDTPSRSRLTRNWRRYSSRRRVLHPALSAGAGRAASIAVYTALFLMIPGNALYWFEVFLDLRLLLMLVGLALLGLWRLGQLFCTAAHALRLRRALDRGKPLPRTGLRAARVRAWGALASGVGVVRPSSLCAPPRESRQEHPLDPAGLAAEGRPVITAAGLGGHDRESDVMWQEGESPSCRGYPLFRAGCRRAACSVERLDAHCPVLAEMAFRELSAKADRDATVL